VDSGEVYPVHTDHLEFLLDKRAILKL